MELLQTFNEENVPEETAQTYRWRQASRAIVFDNDDNVALLYISKHDYYELPGGGIEAGETPEQGCIRECKEEIGCDVEIVKPVGRTLEYRGKLERVNESFCFLAKCIGEKGLPSLQDNEIERGTETIWVTKEKAFELIEGRLEKLKDTLRLYDKYVIERSIVFLKAL